jgi:hypothetical protein
MSSIARCCRPVPPEEILGFITLGRGGQHPSGRARANLVRLRDANPQRVLAVDWGAAFGRAHVPGRRADPMPSTGVGWFATSRAYSRTSTSASRP